MNDKECPKSDVCELFGVGFCHGHSADCQVYQNYMLRKAEEDFVRALEKYCFKDSWFAKIGSKFVSKIKAIFNKLTRGGVSANS